MATNSSQKNQNKIGGKDLITIGIFTALYFVLIAVAGMLGYIPIFIPLMVVLVPLIGGIPFMLFVTKAKKFGMVLIMGVLVALCMLVGGMGYWALPISIVTSLIAELILKSGNYTSAKKSVLGCGVFNMWILGNFVPFYVGDSYYATLAERFGQAYVDTLQSYLPLWFIPVMIIASFAFGIVGALIGKSLCKKHFQRAGII